MVQYLRLPIDDCKFTAGYKNAKLVALGKRNVCKGFVFKYLD